MFSVNVMSRTQDGQEEFCESLPTRSPPLRVSSHYSRPSWRQSVDFCGAKTASGRSVSDVTTAVRPPPPPLTPFHFFFAHGSENRPQIVGRKSAAQSSKWASVTVVPNHFLGQECCADVSFQRPLSTVICPLSSFPSVHIKSTHKPSQSTL